MSAITVSVSLTHTLLDRVTDNFAERAESVTYRFVTLAPGVEGPAAAAVAEVSNAALDAAARALAVRLRERCGVGDRALILCEPGLDYVLAFYGCLYAGVIAVPVYPPNPTQLNQSLARLRGILADCEPTVILATSLLNQLSVMAKGLVPQLDTLPWIVVDEIGTDGADSWRRPPVIAQDPAFLQYTSGSTGHPKGVIVTHHNLEHQLELLVGTFAGPEGRPCHALTWLPPYHDMGLIGTLLAPALGPHTSTAFDPLAFLKHPRRWLQLVGEVGATLTGAPNFAYDLCVSKTSPQQREGLDLSGLEVAFSGAEPVRAGTLRRFTEAFAPYGFRGEAFLPCYGLAEATLCVTAATRLTGPRYVAGSAGPAELPGSAHSQEDSATLVSSGSPIPEHEVVVVDPESTTRVPTGIVGEIWVRGPSVATGYWRDPELTAATFGATLEREDGCWLRTGDLGFIDRDEVVIVGRLKDVIIVAGRNHYPHDVEDTITASDPLMRRGCVAVFTLDASSSSVAAIQEVAGPATEADLDRLIQAACAAVAETHGLPLAELALARPGSVPKTSSGKIRRLAAREAYLAGELDDRIRRVWRRSSARGGVLR